MSEAVPSKKTVEDFPEPQVLNKREARDIDAFEWIIPRECKINRFQSYQDAMNFMAACISKAPELLGVKVPTFIPTTLMRDWLLTNNLKVVPQKFPKIEDRWRNGWYFYHITHISPVEKKEELRYFVSFPMQYVGKKELGGKIVMANQPEWHVRTNVKL